MRSVLVVSIALVCASAYGQNSISDVHNSLLCEGLFRPIGKFTRSEVSQELVRRNEDCKAYMPVIQAMIEQSENGRRIDSANQMNLGMQLLQMGQAKPPAPAQPSFGTRCQTRWMNGVAYTSCD